MTTVNPQRQTKVYFSTVVRAASIPEGGQVALLDWQTKEIEAQVPIYPTNPEITDPNPRGNTRGGRGIALLGDHVVVASYHTLKVYDRNLVHQRDISHPLMAGLHEIHTDGERRIWCASTSLNAALVIDFETGETVEEYWPREMPGFQQALDLIPMEIDKSADNRTEFLVRDPADNPYHLHLNTVVPWRGETYALFHGFGAVVNLDREEIVIRDQALHRAHNLLFHDDGTVSINDTYGRAIRTYDLETGSLERVIDLTEFKPVRDAIRKNQLGYLVKGVLRKLRFHQMSVPRPVFVRGLDKLDNRLFVGMSPAIILCIDWESGALIDWYQHSEDVATCVHGLEATLA